MSDHIFHDVCLHITWHTKNDEPLLREDIEQALNYFVRRRCAQTKGVVLHGIGGTKTHIHLAVNIEPFINISNFVGDIKGASSREINRLKGFKVLYWQRGFGVVSFGWRNLPFVLEYLGKQKEHHSKGTVRDRLECSINEKVAALEAYNEDA